MKARKMDAAADADGEVEVEVEVDADVDAEERLRNVTLGMKRQADELLLADELDRALQLYRELLMHLTRSQVTLLQQRELVVSCRMNVLAALSKAQRWSDVVSEATETLRVFAELQTAAKKQDAADSATPQGAEEMLAAQVLARAYYFRGHAYLRLGTFAPAEQDLRRALTLSPEDEALQEDWKELQACLQSEQKVRQFLATSMKYFQTGKYTAAVDCCLNALRESQALQKTEVTGLIHGNLAAIYVKAKDDTKAIEHYKRTLLLTRRSEDPTTAQNERVYDILDSLAGCYSRKRDYSSALSVVQDQMKMLPLCPGRKDREAMMHLNGGRVCYTLGKFAAAETYFEQAHNAAMKETASQLDVALNSALWLSKACVKTGKLEKAMETLDTAIPVAEHETGEAGVSAERLEKLLLARVELLDPEEAAPDSSESSSPAASPEREAQLWHTLEYFATKRQICGHLRAAEALVGMLKAKDEGAESAETRAEMLRALEVVADVNIGKLSTSEASIMMKLVLCKVDLVLGYDSMGVQEAKALLVKTLSGLELPGGSNPSSRKELLGIAFRRLVAISNSEEGDESDEETREFLEEAVEFLQEGQDEDEALLSVLLPKVGRWKAEQGDTLAAEKVMEECVGLLRRVHGAESDRVCEALVGLCVLQLKLGKTEEARATMTQIEAFPKSQQMSELSVIKDRLRAASEDKKKKLSRVETSSEESLLLEKKRSAAGRNGGSTSQSARPLWARWCGALFACVVAIGIIMLCA